MRRTYPSNVQANKAQTSMNRRRWTNQIDGMHVPISLNSRAAAATAYWSVSQARYAGTGAEENPVATRKREPVSNGQYLRSSNDSSCARLQTGLHIRRRDAEEGSPVPTRLARVMRRATLHPGLQADRWGKRRCDMSWVPSSSLTKCSI